VAPWATTIGVVRERKWNGRRTATAVPPLGHQPPTGRRYATKAAVLLLALPAAVALIVGLVLLLTRSVSRLSQPTSANQGLALAHGAPAAKTRGARVSTAKRSGRQSDARTGTELRDPEEARSFPVSATALAHRPAASSPRKAAEAYVAPGALSTASVKRELARISSLQRSASAGIATVPGGDSVAGNGTIPIPTDVPPVVQRVIAGANAIADFPYVYGGGHLSFQDNAYDCSGSVSYALAAGGLLQRPETSGELESWGVPGPGKWITVYANAGHVYMYVNVGGGVWMRYDTVGRSGPYASRWQPEARSNEGFVARHWPGL
jgi:cell wall-associated NlpC family hydrolase